jgi:hypothetical protein
MKPSLCQLVDAVLSAFQGTVGQYPDNDSFAAQKIQQFRGSRVGPALKFQYAVNIK